jgi:hypothetical protein
MATFNYGEADRGYIELRAEIDEEIPVEMVQAWGAIRIAAALEFLGDRIGDVEGAISGLSRG